MIKRLHISNYALIDNLDIDFDDCLTIITGETGAGKSIILGALTLILGDRADAKAIRDKSQKTIVEATFDIAGYRLETFFEDNDIDWDEHECLIRREVIPAGRSRSFVNDTPVALGILRELSTRLVDIHSQHSNMLLANASYQLSVLDNIAGNLPILNEYKSAYNAYRDAQRKLESTKQDIERLRQNEDYIRFQLDQLLDMNLRPDEDQQLDAQQKLLANVSAIKEDLWVAGNELDTADGSILERLSSVVQHLDHAEQHLGGDGQGLADRLRTAVVEMKDIAQSINAISETLNDDPAELARVEQRLNDIYTLLRKHNVADVNQLIEVRDDYQHQLDEIVHNDDVVQQLTEQLEQKRTDALQLARQLSTRRHEAAQLFIAELMRLAMPLGMKNIAFDINISPTELSANGTDAVEFMMAFNKNQQLMPVRETASGGEISRVMLCVKSIIAHHMQLPTIIFDEVDTGISGDVASRVGEMMSDIANHIQVIAITHLPQVAAHATRHLRVFKTDTDSETLTHVQGLDQQEHIIEVARMLSGKNLDQAAIENAKSLIQNALKQQKAS